jgi:hypothetical protein
MRLGVGIELYDTSAWLNSYLNGVDNKDTKKQIEDPLENQKEKLDDLISEVTSNS